MKGKQERHRIIKEVVGSGKVASQEDLAALLESRGIEVAQATLSRDIRDLGITKLHDGTGYFYSLPPRAAPADHYSIIIAHILIIAKSVMDK